MLNVTIEKLNDTVVLHCAGRIVRGEETALLCAASRQHGRTVVIDLGRVDAIDAAGIGMLVSLQAAGIYLRLMNPNQNVREMLRVTHLDSIFEVCEPRSAQELPEASSPVNDELRSQQSTFRLTA
jgi:anti-anti-sigma factor